MAPDPTSDDEATYDVVIAGYGPVGAVLANLLGRAGHRVAVFERAPSVYHMPRAAHFDHEIMRVLQSVGLAEAVAPSTTGLRGMHFLNDDGELLFGFDQPDGPSPHGWDRAYMFYQPTLEAALRTGVDRFENVDVFLLHEVEGIVANDDHVEVHVRDLAHDDARAVVGRFLVGCEGARSFTRKAAGIELEDIGFDEPWLVVDVELKRPLDLPEHCHQICDPARPTTFVPMPEPYRRWEFMLLPGESVEEMEKPERVRELLAGWIDPDDVEIIRAVVYTFHAVIAHGWRQGRVLLAGDSAHQMPPFLGQGMCSGVRDAANLAWKLDLVLRGLAEDALLDSYEQERSPHVRAIINLAVMMGGVICTLDRAVAEQRDRGFIDNPSTRPGADSDPGMPPLTAGVLDRDDHGAPRAPAGLLFIQPPVRVAAGGTVLLDDAFGRGFATVQRRATDRFEVRPLIIGDATPSIDADGPTEVIDTDGFLGRWFDEHRVEAVVLRPDRYVFGGVASTADLPALLGELAAAF